MSPGADLREAVDQLLAAVNEADAWCSTLLDLVEGQGPGAPQWPYAVAGMVRRVLAAAEAVDAAQLRAPGGAA
jgi:hypothetical protein